VSHFLIVVMSVIKFGVILVSVLVLKNQQWGMSVRGTVMTVWLDLGILRLPTSSQLTCPGDDADILKTETSKFLS